MPLFNDAQNKIYGTGEISWENNIFSAGLINRSLLIEQKEKELKESEGLLHFEDWGYFNELDFLYGKTFLKNTFFEKALDSGHTIARSDIIEFKSSVGIEIDTFVIFEEQSHLSIFYKTFEPTHLNINIGFNVSVLIDLGTFIPKNTEKIARCPDCHIPYCKKQEKYTCLNCGNNLKIFNRFEILKLPG